MIPETIGDYLERYHKGGANAVTSRELEITFSVKGIQIRDMVNALRREGVPIASSGRGYFYAATQQEVRDTIAHMTNRITSIRAAIAGLRQSLELFDTGQFRLPLDSSEGEVKPP